MTAEYLHVVGPGEGEAIWFLQTLMTVKASGDESGGAFSLIEAHYPPALAHSRSPLSQQPLVDLRRFS